MLWSINLLVIICHSLLNTPQEHIHLYFSILSCSFFQSLTAHIIYKFRQLTSDFLPGIASYRIFSVICTTLFPCQDHIPTCLDKLVQPCSWAKVVCLSLTDIPVHEWKRILVVVVPCAISLLCGQIWNRRRQLLSATWNSELTFSSDSFNPIVILYKLFIKGTIQERLILCTDLHKRAFDVV